MCGTMIRQMMCPSICRFRVCVQCSEAVHFCSACLKSEKSLPIHAHAMPSSKSWFPLATLTPASAFLQLHLRVQIRPGHRERPADEHALLPHHAASQQHQRGQFLPWCSVLQPHQHAGEPCSSDELVAEWCSALVIFERCHGPLDTRTCRVGLSGRSLTLAGAGWADLVMVVTIRIRCAVRQLGGVPAASGPAARLLQAEVSAAGCQLPGGANMKPSAYPPQ